MLPSGLIVLNRVYGIELTYLLSAWSALRVPIYSLVPFLHFTVTGNTKFNKKTKNTLKLIRHLNHLHNWNMDILKMGKRES